MIATYHPLHPLYYLSECDNQRACLLPQVKGWPKKDSMHSVVYLSAPKNLDLVEAPLVDLERHCRVNSTFNKAASMAPRIYDVDARHRAVFTVARRDTKSTLRAV